jgi:EmrB/QacA subfamily drug resistance transporter
MKNLPSTNACAEPERLWLILAAVLTGPFMTVIDMMIVNVAIPSIRRDFSAGFGDAELVVAGYTLAFAVILITGGRLGDLFGRRRMFIFGLVGFTLTSAFCGASQTISALILGRLLQGVAAAVLFPQAYALIHVNFRGARPRARAFAALGVALGLAAVVGQVFGGVLIAANLLGLAWRPIFLVNIPIGLTAIVAAWRVVPRDIPSTERRLDGTGVILSGVGLGLLLYPLIEGQEAGWPAWTFTMLFAAIPVLAIFVWRQHDKSRRLDSPLLQTDLFSNRMFTLGVLLVMLYYSTHSSFFLAYTFLAQIGLGRSPFSAGVILSTIPMTFMVGSSFAGRIAAERRLIVLSSGAAIKAVGHGAATGTALLAAPMRLEALIPALLLVGLGQGLFVTPLFNTALGGVRHVDIGSASGVLSTMQQIGAAFGVASVGILFATVLDHSRATGAAELDAYARAFAAVSGYAALTSGVIAALLFALHRRIAHSTIRRIA